MKRVEHHGERADRLWAFMLLVLLSAAPWGLALATPTEFSIAAGDAPDTLSDFGRQSGLQMLFEHRAVAGKRTHAIKGSFEPKAALSLLLSETGLMFEFVNDNTVAITSAARPTSALPASSNESAANGSEESAGPLASSSAAAESALPGRVAASDADALARRDRSQDTQYDGRLQEVVVTGTHMTGVSLPSPVIEIGREEIDRSGYTSVTDLMLSLPQNFGGGYNPGTSSQELSQINSRFSNNPGGASAPNLRGLGPGSTLTLVDGHRMASGLSGGGTDISSIPLDAVERIEVITDSASAIYGSDAVAGVVNVILKRDFQGAKTTLSYGLAPDGGGREKRISQLFGTSWQTGNAMIAYEHMQQSGVDARQRDFASTAALPNSLEPAIRVNAVTVAATQDIGAAISLFVDGLYVARDVNQLLYDPPYFPAPAEYPATLDKYAVSAGLNFKLPHDWKATVSGSLARSDTRQVNFFMTTPISDEEAQRQIGTMRNVEANANGAVASLPSGPVELAAGAGYRSEKFTEGFGDSPNTLQNEADGDRRVRYAFGELSLPLVEHSDRPWLRSLDVVASGRAEHYSDFGNKAVPKIGLVYEPAASLKLRTTWGRAFAAPNLNDIHAVQQLVFIDLPTTTAPVAGVPTLLKSGGNPELRPETAESWSLGADFTPTSLQGLRVSGTAFDIKYANRIAAIGNPYMALTDPLNAFFVTESPSLETAQRLYGSYTAREFYSEAVEPLNLGKIAAIVDTRLVNVASQTARGADLNINYAIGAVSKGVVLFLNGAYLDLSQRNTPQAPNNTLSGLAFYPPKFRFRSGATWRIGSWALTGTVNYLSRETNNQVVPNEDVASWTTMDASLRYAPELAGILRGLHLTLAVSNIFDRDPPYLTTQINGINFDSSNTTAMGRYVTLQLSKDW